MTTPLLNTINFFQTLFLDLWFSLKSVKFYKKIMHKRDDYGLLYAFNLSLLAALMCTIVFLYRANFIQDMLRNKELSGGAKDIEFIISQIPEMDYDGQEISLKGESPVIIKTMSGHDIIAIDPKNEIKPSERMKYPFLLTKDKIIMQSFSNDTSDSFPFDLMYFFGQEARILNQQAVRSMLLESTSRYLIYVGFPFLAILNFIAFVRNKVFFIAALIIANFAFKTNTTPKTNIRMVLYAGGISALLEMFFKLFLNNYILIIFILQIWANILMILAITKHDFKKLTTKI